MDDTQDSDATPHGRSRLRGVMLLCALLLLAGLGEKAWDELGLGYRPGPAAEAARVDE
jgi:hypothetical protein